MSWYFYHTTGYRKSHYNEENKIKKITISFAEFYTMARWPTHRSILAKIEWILMWPIITILRMTIPTFWNSRFPWLYVVTFSMCVTWIGVLCYGISWMITLIG